MADNGDQIKIDSSEVESGLESVKKDVESGANSIVKTLGGIGKAVASAFDVSSIVDFGMKIIGTANDIDSAVNSYIAVTGASTEESKRFQEVLESIYANNYGDSFKDISDSMTLVTQKFGDMDDSALQEMVESACLLRDTFGIDVSDSLDSVKTLMDDFGISSQEAYNLIAQGAQSGLNINGDLAEQIAKYSTNFADIGVSAEDMFNAMAEGIDLSSIQWENMGADATLALTNVQGEISNTTDAMGAIEEISFDDVGSMFEGLQRSLELLLVPLGEMLIPILEKFIGLLSPIMELISSIMEPLAQLVEAILTPLIDALSMVLEPLTTLLEVLLPPILDLVTAIIKPLAELSKAILLPLVDVLKVLIEPLTKLMNMILPPLIKLFDGLKPVIEAVMPIVETLASLFADSLGRAIEVVMPYIQGLMDILGGLIDFITNVFAGNWDAAWKGILNMFIGIMNMFPTALEAIINAGIWIINGIIKGINAIIGAIGIKPITLIKNVQLPRIPKQYHIGGIVDFDGRNEGLVLAKDGEMILTQAQQKNLFDMLNGSASADAIAASYGNYSFSYTFNSPKSLSLREIKQEMTLAEQRQRLTGR